MDTVAGSAPLVFLRRAPFSGSGASQALPNFWSPHSSTPLSKTFEHPPLAYSQVQTWRFILSESSRRYRQSDGVEVKYTLRSYTLNGPSPFESCFASLQTSNFTSSSVTTSSMDSSDGFTYMSYETLGYLLKGANTSITFACLMKRDLITRCSHKGSDGETLYAVRGGIGRFIAAAELEGVVAALETMTAPPVKL